MPGTTGEVKGMEHQNPNLNQPKENQRLNPTVVEGLKTKTS